MYERGRNIDVISAVSWDTVDRVDRPTCFVAYTIKGYQLPFAGHKDNHAGLMTPDQVAVFKRTMNIVDGDEWERFAGLDVSPEELSRFIASVPFGQAVERRHRSDRIEIPSEFEVPAGERMSTQEGFGRLLTNIARSHPKVAERIVTTSPDVTLIGIGQPGLTLLEPAYVDELAEMLRWSFEHIQRDDGGAVYLRLSTRPLVQPKRVLTDELKRHITDGAYWLVPPAEGAMLAIAGCGAVITEALEAHQQLLEEFPGAGVLVVTSPDLLQQAWIRRLRDDTDTPRKDVHVAHLLKPLSKSAGLVTVVDGHPAILSWLGSVGPHRIAPLGVDRFGESGEIPDLYRACGLDAGAIVAAARRLAKAALLHDRL